LLISRAGKIDELAALETHNPRDGEGPRVLRPPALLLNVLPSASLDAKLSGVLDDTPI
jgi:hypothetical protein